MKILFNKKDNAFENDKNEVIVENKKKNYVEVVLVDKILSKERRSKMSYSPHMMVAGEPGKGVVFTSKWLLNQAMKNTSDKLVIVDMFGDFKEVRNNVAKEDCTIVDENGGACLNPLDARLDVGSDWGDSFSKLCFLESFFELAMNRRLTMDEKLCLSAAYNSIESKCNKTLDDFHKSLEATGSKNGKVLGGVLLPYLELKAFNNPSTNKTSKVTYVDLSRYSNNCKEVAYMFAMEWVSSQMEKNLMEGCSTFVCLPFMEELEGVPSQFVSDFVKRARTKGGKLFFVTCKIEEFSNKFRGAFQNIATLLLLNRSDSNFEFAEKYLALPKELDNPDAIGRNDGLLIEGSKVSICRYKFESNC